MGEHEYHGSLWYDLDHNKVDPEGFAAVMADPRRIVAQDAVGAWSVSTVFLGMDYGFGMTEQPILYETMIFGPDDWDGEYQVRYYTREEARRGHEQAKAMVGVLDAVSTAAAAEVAPERADSANAEQS